MILSENYKIAKVIGEWVVFPIDENENCLTNKILTLSESGVLLWNKLTIESTIKDLALLLVEEYDVDLQVAEADAGLFVDEIEALGLFRV